MFRIRDTGQVITESEFRSLHSDTSFPAVLTPEILNDFGVDPVLEGAQPTITENQYVRYVGVTQDKKKNWVKNYEAVDYTPEENEARKVSRRASMVVSPLQAKVALLNEGLLDDVEGVINDANTSPVVKLAWNNATEFRRTSPLIDELSITLNLTPEQVDGLFANAASVII